MISRDARDFNIPCLEACFCGLSLCFYIFHFAWTGTFVNEPPPPPPPPNNKKNKGATISHALAQSVCLLVFVDISLIVSCFVSRPIFHSLLFSLKKLLFSKFGGIYIFNYFSFFHSLNHSFLFLPSPLVLCSFYVSLSICTLSLCLTLPYYILATTVVCCNLIADNALSFPLFLFDQL